MTERIYGNPGVDSDMANGDLVLTWYDREHMDAAVIVRIAPESIPDFVRAITSHGLTSMSRAYMQAFTGECERCSNSRMVEEPGPGGREVRMYCPDCKDRSPGLAFANAPVIGPRRKEGF